MSEHVHNTNVSEDGGTRSFWKPCPDCVTRNEETARLREIAEAWRRLHRARCALKTKPADWAEFYEAHARLIKLGEVKE